MSSKFLTKLVVASGLMMIAAFMLQSNNASAVFGHKLLDQTGCHCCACPSCKHICTFESEVVDAERECFETEEKVICIPRVVFPWQKKSQSSCCDCSDQPCSCTHNGAKTRKICVLKTKKYECPECEYTWTAKEKECGSGCASSCCSGDVCSAAPCDAGHWTTSSPAYGQDSITDLSEHPSHPWTAEAPVVSKLPESHAAKYAAPVSVALPQ